MKKGAKKKNRKLRRQVRKTIGALFMASAIVVAAIPVQDVGAAPTGAAEKIKVAVTSTQGEVKTAEQEYPSVVPYVAEATGNANNQVIYTSGDGLFKFAYIRGGTGAVILDYNDLKNNPEVTIPETLEAYRSYSENYQGIEYYCLVSANDELMGYKLRDQPLIDEATGLPYYRTTDRSPNGIDIENIDKITDVRQDDKGFYILYEQTRQKKDENGNLVVDKDGKPVYEKVEARATCEPMLGERIYPCYYNQRQNWGSKPENELYYHPKTAANKDDYTQWLEAGEDQTHWGIRATVKYIGAETIGPKGTGWQLTGFRSNAGDGVFANKNYITTVNIEANLEGISDYTFYNCPKLNKIVFKTGLKTVGNGAFAECRQLREVVMPTADAIGKDAFYNCTALTSFKLPSKTLSHLGDCAFEGCTQLNKVDFLLYDDKGAPDRLGSVPLKWLGNHLFRGCIALSEVEFPNGYFETTALDIDMFQDCTSLQRVILPDTDSGSRIKFDSFHNKDNGGTNYPNCAKNTWEQFRNTVPEEFYFEGPSRSEIHNIANNNAITYKYPGEQLYERVVYESDATVKTVNGVAGNYAKVFYKVRGGEDNIGKLEEFGILERDVDGGGMSEPDIIKIPEKIGTFGIASIEAGSFNDICSLKQVTIPASVTEIGTNAFKGCHNLRTVIFTDASTMKSIEADAFKTQEVQTTCKHRSTLYPTTGADKPYLYFVGAMLKEDGSDTETFKFAMSGTDGSKISHGNSEDIWITCHSGWPTNLEVKYYSDPATQTGEAQLVGYPRYDRVKKDINGWIEALPYLKNASNTEKTEYYNMIDRAIRFNGGGLKPDEQDLTPNEQAFLAATLDITIPENVDSIWPGLFSGVNKDGVEVGEGGVDDKGQAIGDLIGADESIRSITINGVGELDPYTFKECISLKSAAVIGSQLVGDYAFEGCTALTEATIGSKLEDTGMRPFKGCTELSNINCFTPGNFTYNSGILYRNVNGGKEIVECLENRGKTGGSGLYTVGPDELQGVTAIKKEAFAECKDVAQVDLSKTSIGTISEGSFKEMELNSIILPNSLSRIEADAFKDNDTKRFIVYYKNSNPITMTKDAFQPLDGDPTKKGDREVIFQCSIPSNAATYAEDYEYITVSDEEVFEEFTVNFYNTPDYPASTNLELLSTQTIRAGEDAEEPSTEGLKCNNDKLMFIGWDKPFTNVRSDLNILAMYGSPQYTVIFLDGFDGNELGRETVSAGGSATLPKVPNHPGYEFVGWDKPHYDIQANTTIVAKFVDASGDASRFTVSFYLDDGDEEPWWETHASINEVVKGPIPPAREGYTFVRWIWAPASSETGVKQDTSVYAQWTPGSGGNNPGGNPGGNPSGNPGGSSDPNATRSPKPTSSTSPSPSSSPEVTKYTVSVSGGSGSGRYAAGEIVAVNAYYMGEGQAFDRWTSSTAGVGFSNPNATSATFTMPAANVAITATYKTGSGTAGGTGGGSGAGTGTGGSSGGSGTTSNNGTTVEVTKPGISNTNYAGASVSGATDNFIVKVTEDQSATDAVIAALQARYGDISRIKYLPMDISLYDSTGRTRIADTTGITVNLTLPLPDDLVQYAGNNKVAAVSNGALEDLNVRFTTVGGVPCVNFTATHFSPYVIYVDTANLTEATIDTTPKTGDPIHPKWFLALGMACISLVLFFKRDKVVVKSKTA